MSSIAHASHPFPETTTFEVIALEGLQSPIVRQGVEYWTRLRGARRFPARNDINPHAITALLPHMILVRLFDGGADFELRIVGDEVVRAYRAPLMNRLLSDIATDLPLVTKRMSDVYRRVVESGMPLAVHTCVGFDAPEVNFVDAEDVFLPLGMQDDTVDHLLTFGKHVLHPAQG